MNSSNNSNSNNASISQVHANRTLVYSNVPVGVEHAAIYAALFGEDPHLAQLEEGQPPATRPDGPHPVAHRGVQRWRWAIRRVRLFRPFPAAKRQIVFVEFHKPRDAGEALAEFAGRGPVVLGDAHGIEVAWALQPIDPHRGNPADYDPPTNRPCLFGLDGGEKANVNRWYLFDQAVFNAAFRRQRQREDGSPQPPAPEAHDSAPTDHD